MQVQPSLFIEQRSAIQQEIDSNSLLEENINEAFYRIEELTAAPIKRKRIEGDTLQGSFKYDINKNGKDTRIEWLYDPSKTIHMTRDQRAFLHFCQGQLFNQLDDYHELAEKFLTKSVLLNPKCGSSWNSLGETMWKKGDIECSLKCFKTALVHCRSKEVLRNIALAQSIDSAKEALALDFNDPFSWASLGTSIMQKFFSVSLKDSELYQSIKAYSKALKLYLEEYDDAIKDSENCIALDKLHENAINLLSDLSRHLESVKSWCFKKIPKFKIYL
ncbi:hypothetical protein ROZALSC1DRAFT_31716, partial [Rozella allomycis CSF55]